MSLVKETESVEVETVMTIHVLKVKDGRPSPYLYIVNQPGKEPVQSTQYERFGVAIARLRNYLAYWR